MAGSNDSVLPRLPQSWLARQPLKALYLIQHLCKGILLHPYWIALHMLGIGPFPRSYTLKETLSIRFLRFLQWAVPRCEIYPNVLDHSQINIISLNKTLKETRAIWIGPPADTSQWFKGIAVKKGCEPQRILGVIWGKKAKNLDRTKDLHYHKGEKVLLYFHGGALAAGNALESARSAGQFQLPCIFPTAGIVQDFNSADCCNVYVFLWAEFPRQIIKSGHIQHALCADYRKVNSGPFPMQLVDCITAWAYLVDTVGVAPADILLGGDSAGAHLTLCLTRYLRDELETELPARLFLSSPWVAMHESIGPAAVLYKPVEQDMLNWNALQPFISHRLLLDSPVSLMDSAWLSPAAPNCPASKELFENFPASFLIGTAQEALTEEIRELVARFKLSKVEHVYYEEPEACHNFLGFSFVPKEKRQRAWLAIHDWLNQQWPEA